MIIIRELLWRNHTQRHKIAPLLSGNDMDAQEYSLG